MLWLMVKSFSINQWNRNLKTYKNIRKSATGQGDDYTTGCLLHYSYFFKYYDKMITIGLSKQQVLDADPSQAQFNKLILQQI